MKKHFLDNLMLHLNSISRLAAMENAGQTQKHTGKVINSIRYKTSRENQLLTVNEEIKAVENFLDIFKMRFGDSLQYQMDIDTEALSCYIPHYTLMTFVENALYHAFETTEGTREFKISVKRTDNSLDIEINDNGCGFEPEKSMHENSCNMLYGTILSTVKRLSAFFNSPETVNIMSCPSKGTSVQIRIPI
ncbi:MAG: histidine kinase [Clostridia bacterium]|nr:histidine kinase [Clostridia bacterium]